MQVSSINWTTFTGWEANETISGKLNNKKLLNNLAYVSKVDSIRTYKSPDNKYLPANDMYITIVSKRFDDKFCLASDCFITPKDVSVEKLSEGIFESAQSAVGKLYGKLASYVDLKETKANSDIAPVLGGKKSHNFLKKLFGIFKKF